MQSVFVSFAVVGKPEPAGSKRAFVPKDKHGRPYQREGGAIIVNVVDDNAKSKGWQKLVANTARSAMAGRPPETGPVRLGLTFRVVRPLSHFGTGKNADKLKDSAPIFPTSKPDVLKLARGVEDAMTGIVYADDAQIVVETLVKQFGHEPGVSVTVTRLA